MPSRSGRCGSRIQSALPSRSHSQPITTATTRLATPRATTISRSFGKATAVAVSTIGLIAGAASRNASAAAGVTPRRISEPAIGTLPHSQPGSTTPATLATGTASAGMPGQRPGPERAGHEHRDDRGQHHAEDQERHRLHEHRDEHRGPGLQPGTGDQRGERVAEHHEQHQHDREDLDGSDGPARTGGRWLIGQCGGPVGHGRHPNVRAGARPNVHLRICTSASAHLPRRQRDDGLSNSANVTSRRNSKPRSS